MTTEIDPEIIRAFSSWLNVDLIRYDDDGELLGAARAASVAAMNRGVSASRIDEQLSVVLHSWTSRDAVPFMDATDVDWLIDDEGERKLKMILGEMVVEARSHAEQAK